MSSASSIISDSGRLKYMVEDVICTLLTQPPSSSAGGESDSSVNCRSIGDGDGCTGKERW